MTIRKRLQIMAIFAVATMTMLLGMMVFSTNELQQYEEVRSSVSSFEIDVLSLRKHEKDFIARKNWKYVEKHQQKTDSLLASIDQFIHETGRFTNEKEIVLAQAYKETIIRYSTEFNRVADLTKELGLDEKSGLYGGLRSAVREVEDQIKQSQKFNASADTLTKDILMLRRNEKDFMLRLNLKYQARFEKNYAVFMRDLDQSKLSPKIKTALKEKMAIYQQAFNQFIDMNLTLGLNEKSGLYGAMRTEIHSLSKVTAQLQEEAHMSTEAAKSWLEIFAVIFSLLVMIGLMFYIYRTSKSISEGMDGILNSIRMTNESCEFKNPIKTDRSDEFGEIADLFNDLLQNVDTHFEEINHVMQSVADGAFSSRIESENHGDFKRLVSKVNSALNTMEELEKIISAIGHGNFQARLSNSISNPLRDLVNQSMVSTEQTLSEISGVMSKVANAEFDSNLDLKVKGQWAPMQDATNNAIAELKSNFDALNEQFEEMAAGNLTVQMTPSTKGELAKLTKNFNRSVSAMRSAMTEIKSVSYQVKADIDDIHRANKHLIKKTTENSHMVEETASALEEMFTSIKQNSDNTVQTSKLAEDTAVLAASGSDIMKRTIENMAVIGESSNKIADIVNIIDSIAFQTNLLALNAAVEAARAGEHGRGFAVVAGEVRNLSSRSAEAATQIKALITTSVEEVSKGAELSEQSGESLEQVVAAISKMKGKVARIANSSQEQSNSAKEIGNSVAVMDSNIQANSSDMQKVGHTVESMVNLADGMQQKVDRFVI